MISGRQNHDIISILSTFPSSNLIEINCYFMYKKVAIFLHLVQKDFSGDLIHSSLRYNMSLVKQSRDLYWVEISHHQKLVNKCIMLWLLQFVPMVAYLHIYCFLKTDLYCYVLTILFFRTCVLESPIINLDLFTWDTL